LYYWAEKQKTANVLADRKSNGVPANYMINEHLQPYFAKDGSKLYFGTNPILAVPDTTLLPEEMVSVDVWHWQDAKLQSQQNVELANEKKRGYLAVVYPKLRKITQLGSPEIPTVITATEGNAEVCLGISTKPHERQSTWEGYPIASDIYLISTREGKPRRVKEKLKATNLRISPNAQYIAWYAPADTAWFAYSIRTGQIANLTKGVKTKFYDELFDMPDFPESYGDLGWTEGDQTFLVYDRYDIWALHPENKAPAQRITQNGRENKFEYRYVRLDPEEKFLKTDQVMFLRVFDEETKGSGYFTKKLNDSELPRKLTLGEYSYGNPLKAKQADRYVFSRETFQDFPDLYHTDINFVKVNRLSNANPQQANYWWGSVELVKWTAPSGEELHGLLYKPENFDEEKKYPMLTYFYERLSDGLYNYVRPEPSWSTIRASVYTSNGYVVFMPDIPYRTGQPGQSAYDAIMSGVSHVLGLGFVDKDKLGIHGQSWGGYQTAYVITRTDLFACAMAGAPVANMTSAYGGIRWGTGISRMWQYEHSQSRLGATLWEKPLLYLENSPLFQADKVNTPLLMMHNDKDGAVPWYQGIEFYTALRRLNRPVWMLTYNGEDHNLIERKNRKDLTVRMMQFFDYYLKFAPMPYWMRNGVPALEKGIKMRYETESER
jgi:dipeptidyl aminopeptidase/acylaminoacyl peptidase